ncbi:hypothetical protein DPMN_159329 [Dreissena polymorpha]|uniref:Uncharacterized protein n=1 Tax=Dreissena polymorpha TaxID=45954 RepID=A0A9D4ELC7_DREPO|nr:hypothetical protein DPMN_159329 [Dreissena polymorpha]
MNIRPSEMYYSQDSINIYFDKRSPHNRKRIGETLNDICEGRCRVSSIPTITVVYRYGKWVTADNRRLWVFRELERLGKCDSIYVHIGSFIPPRKLTSYNCGVSIRVRGDPGGYWNRQVRSSRQTPLAASASYSPRASDRDREYNHYNDDEELLELRTLMRRMNFRSNISYLRKLFPTCDHKMIA